MLLLFLIWVMDIPCHLLHLLLFLLSVRHCCCSPPMSFSFWQYFLGSFVGDLPQISLRQIWLQFTADIRKHFPLSLSLSPVRETTHIQEREDGGSAVKRSGVHIVAHASECHERVVEGRSRQATQACCRQLDVCTHPRRPRRLHLLVCIFSRSKLIFQSFFCCYCCCLSLSLSLSLSLYCKFL